MEVAGEDVDGPGHVLGGGGRVEGQTQPLGPNRSDDPGRVHQLRDFGVGHGRDDGRVPGGQAEPGAEFVGQANGVGV